MTDELRTIGLGHVSPEFFKVDESCGNLHTFSPPSAGIQFARCGLNSPNAATCQVGRLICDACPGLTV
jgi:hypothetical protein